MPYTAVYNYPTNGRITGPNPIDWGQEVVIQALNGYTIQTAQYRITFTDSTPEQSGSISTGTGTITSWTPSSTLVASFLQSRINQIIVTMTVNPPAEPAKPITYVNTSANGTISGNSTFKWGDSVQVKVNPGYRVEILQHRWRITGYPDDVRNVANQAKKVGTYSLPLTKDMVFSSRGDLVTSAELTLSVEPSRWIGHFITDEGVGAMPDSTIMSDSSLTFNARSGYAFTGINYSFYATDNVTQGITPTVTYGSVPTTSGQTSVTFRLLDVMTEAQKALADTAVRVDFDFYTEIDPNADGSLAVTNQLVNATSNVVGGRVKAEDTLVITAAPGHFFHTNHDIEVKFEVSSGVFTGRNFRPDLHPQYFSRGNTIFTLPLAEEWEPALGLTLRTTAEDWDLYDTFYKEALTLVKSNVSQANKTVPDGFVLELEVDDLFNYGRVFKGYITVEKIIDYDTIVETYNIHDNPELFDAKNTMFTLPLTVAAGKKLRYVTVTAEGETPSFQLELDPSSTGLTVDFPGIRQINDTIRVRANELNDYHGFDGDLIMTFIVNGQPEVVRFNRVENPEYFDRENSVFTINFKLKWAYDNINKVVSKVIIKGRTKKERLWEATDPLGPATDLDTEDNLWSSITPYVNWNFRYEVTKDSNYYFDAIRFYFLNGAKEVVEVVSVNRVDNPDYFFYRGSVTGEGSGLWVGFDMAKHWHLVEEHEGTANEIEHFSAYVHAVEDGLLWDGEKYVVRSDIDRDRDWGAPPTTMSPNKDSNTQEIDTFPFVYGVNDSKTFVPGITEPIYNFPNPNPVPLEPEPDTDGDGVPDSYDPTEPPGTLTDAEKIALDRTALTLGDTTAVTSNLPLPTSGAKGSTITWVSSKTSVVTNTGIVTRPAAGQSDALVTLAAVLKLGQEQLTKEFVVIVKAYPNVTEPDRDGDGIPDSTDPYPDDPTNTPPDGGGDPVHPPGSGDASYYETLLNATSNLEVHDIGAGTSSASGGVAKDVPLVLRANEGYEFKDVIRIIYVADGAPSRTKTFYPDSASDTKYFNDDSTIFTVTLEEFWLDPYGMDNVRSIQVFATAKEKYLGEDPVDGIGDLTTSFANVYHADNGILSRLSTERFYESQSGLMSDYGDYIYNVYKFPLKIDESLISQGTTNIKLGHYTSLTQSRYFHKSRLQFSLGKIKVDEVYNNVYDYRDVVCKIHVPYSEPIEIDPTYVIGTQVELIYFLDLYNGAVTLDVYSDRIDGGLALRQDIPVSYGIPFLKQENSDVKGEVGRYINNKIKTPYIEVSRNKPYDTWTQFGKQGKAYGQLSEFSGYIEVPDVNLQSEATAAEMELIKSMLSTGIIINP